MTVKFTNSCAPIIYPCPVGRKYISPCTCLHYLECATGGYDFLERDCGIGTAWNHRTDFCESENTVLMGSGKPICDQNEPWLRCDSVQDHYVLNQLEDFCQTGTTPMIPRQEEDGDDGGVSTPAIVGGVIGGLAVLVLVGIFILLLKKRHDGNSNKSNFDVRASAFKQRKGMEKEEEVYDVINDKSVASSIKNSIYSKELDSQYDNPTFSNKFERNEYSGLEPQGHTTHSNRPTGLDASGKSSTTLSSTSTPRDDLSRSITVSGKDILVEDSEGYHVGYPSGVIPRQPSPLPPDNAVDYGFDLGNSALPNDYLELEKTEL